MIEQMVYSYWVSRGEMPEIRIYSIEKKDNNAPNLKAGNGF